VARRLVIIDGYSLLYRAFFATRYLSTSDGRPTNALHGFVAMLFNLLDKVEPQSIVVAMDAPGKTFRHAEFTGYKATRKETQDELRVQLVAARELIQALGIPTVECTGFEADDVVGTISRQGEENGYDTTVVTGDLDSLQLVDDHVSVLTMKQGVQDTVTYTPVEVQERYGFGPEFIPDFKALKGDASDNIPGVPGIGDKGAAELINGFGTIEQMLERFDEIPDKFRKKMDGLQDQMRLSKHLATIVRDAPCEFDFQAFQINQTQMEAAIAMLENYELRTHVKRAPQVLGRYLEGQTEGERPSVAEVKEEALAFRSPEGGLDDLVGDGAFAVYFASPLNRRDLLDDGGAAFVAVGDRVLAVTEAEALELVRRAPERVVMHDAKPAYKRLPGLTAVPDFDTLLAAYVLRSERGNYALRELIMGYLEVSPPTSGEQMAVGIYQLSEILAERLAKEGQDSVLTDVELPLVPILAQMERYGVQTDRDQLREFSKTLQVEIDRLTSRIHELAGRDFNIGSPKQLGEVLFDELKLGGAQKTKTGYATGVEVLGELAAEHEIVADVLSWRELTKLKSTYADSLEKLIATDGRIHTTYNQAVAATGRLSSNDPNLQNIPIRTELGRGIRRAFQAAPGFQLASLDYSQIELRVLAHMCEEPALVAAFRDRVDVHTVTARAMFHAEDVTKEQRRLAKMLNYAVLYGVSEFGLAQQLGSGFSIAEAKALIQQYNERFPSVKEFTNAIVAEAKSKGFTTTLLGRRRYFPDIHAGRIQERRYAERQAMNAPIQGTAADMLKLAMIRCQELLNGRETRMILNVHDELVFELRDGEEELIPALRQAMEQALPLNVPVEADAKIGLDWNEMTPV
jgi:DNA polymerase-1